MKIFKIILFLLLVFLKAQPGAFSQQVLFGNYSVAEGLPSTMVCGIVQDDQGYMWFGTRNGLSRFDGYQFKTFQANKNVPGSIGNNFIHCITRIDSLHLWVGTENGVYILNLEQEKFSHLVYTKGQTVAGILKDQKGIVYISTTMNGLYIVDPAQNSTRHFLYNGSDNSISNNRLSNMAMDASGRIWIGTTGSGIDIYNPANAVFTNIRAGQRGLTSDAVISLYKGLNGTIWVGTMNGGLCRWQKETQTFKSYRSGGEDAIRDDIIRAIYQVTPDKLYVGTEKGLNVLNLTNEKFAAHTNKLNDPFGISDNAVYAICLDKAGNMWVGTWFGGVSYFKEAGNAFELYYPQLANGSLHGRAVSCFLEDASNKFWVGTEDAGLYYFDANTRLFQQYPFKAGQDKLSYHNVHVLCRDKDNNIWIGLFAGGINVLNPSTGKIRRFDQQPGNNRSLNSNLVFSLYRDRQDRIWVGTERGISRYNPVTNDFDQIHHPVADNVLVYDIYEDDEGTMWFATYNNNSNGLLSYKQSTNTWNIIPAGDNDNMLNCSKLICLHDDHNGNLYIGTDGGGLNCYNYKNRQVKIYDASKGINANVIYGIQQDDNGLLWMSSNNGIFSLNPQTGAVKHFTRQDNLQSKQFNYKSFYKASDGKMFVGGIKGFNAFYPQNVTEEHATARISFTNFQLFNRNVSPNDENSPINKQINYTRQVELSHDQSVFSFEYAILNYAAPEKVKYAYLMEGFDPTWNEVGDQRKATYTNLSPGHYTFKVKATTDESNWNVNESAISVIIHPPFYKTTLAYLIYVLIGIVLAYAVYRYSINYIKKQNRIKLERIKNKEEQEFYARKIEFFTVMAHEIRTPLTLIIAPLEKLLALHKWDKNEKEQLQIMDENAERLMDLVNQLLDFRRIESDAYDIKPEKLELVSLVQSIYSRFSALPFQKEVEFTMVTKISQLSIYADPEVLQKILSNLLINAFKFARKKVVLTIHEISKQDDHHLFSISVEDDGIGIPATNIKNIFRKFFTTAKGGHEYHNLGSSGIGLALASSLAERHGGRLLVESKENVRTVFTLELPVMSEQDIQKNEPVIEVIEDEVVDADLPMILVVDDDEAILSFLVSSLKAEGYKAVGQANGKLALEYLDSNAVDLIVSDIMMPEMDGFAFCKAVKSDINFSHIPFVLLTARSNSEAEIEGIETGADAYIMKPFKWKHVAAVVKNLIESREKLKKRFSEYPQADITDLATNTRDKQFMEKVVQIIEDRIIDPQLSVEELSKDMTMSRSNLHKKLKSLSGFGPNELIRLVRLKHAAKLLQTEDISIAEIGYRTGFSSPSYFSKCFIQQFKVSPKEYADRQSTNPKKEMGELIEREITK